MDIGPIDLVWGRDGDAAKGYADGYGLAHILAKHPELDPHDLEPIVASAKQTAQYGNSVQLETPDHHAAVKLDWNGSDKKWLLTAFQKGEGAVEGSIGVSDNLRSTHPVDQAPSLGKKDTADAPADADFGQPSAPSILKGTRSPATERAAHTMTRARRSWCVTPAAIAGY